MADSMPICDVLSEAMEYLTKLGTNIRIRSENLRDKRIRKDKLRNTHAIHKVVDKVLLICELSKKSIENVETGVKNLLVQMEKAGATFGPGPKTRETSESGVKFEYFTYESHTLKIRDKISVGHYTSVKVVSTSMTLSMIEEYPVYHDCKLYRLRKKKKRKELGASISQCSFSAFQDLDVKENTCIAGLEDNTSNEDNISRENNCKEMESMHKRESTYNKKVESELENTRLQIDNEEIKSDGYQSHGHMSKNEMKPSNPVVEEMLCPDQNKDESDCESKPKKKKYNENAKRFRHIKVMDSSSSSDNRKDDEEISLSKMHSKNYSKTEESFEKTGENHDDMKTLEGSDTIKPLIKCVSLSKLLKPDRVKDIDIENTEEPKKGKEDKTLKRKQMYAKSVLRKEIKFKNNSLHRIHDTCNESGDEDEYWLHKRKEVKNFKPKEFNINLTRLPKITHAILTKYHLKKISHMGSIICEILNDTDKKNDDKENNESESKRINITGICDETDPMQNVDINKVKSALLYDSDSDNVETFQGNNKRTLRKAVTNDSDTENSSNNNEDPETELYGNEKNEIVLELYCATTSTKTKHCAVNVLECQTTDNMNLQIENKTFNKSECITNTEKETQECEKQNAGSIKDVLNKPDHKIVETARSTDIGENCKKVKSALHAEPEPKTVSKQKDDRDDSQEKQEHSKSSSEPEKLNVIGVKKTKKNHSDKSGLKPKKSHTKKNKLQNVNDDNQPSELQNFFCEDSGSKQKDSDKFKNALLEESDSDPQNDKKVENTCKSKKSLLEDSGCRSQNDKDMAKSTDEVKKALLDESDCEPHNKIERENPCTVKSALLADSDSESRDFDENNQEKKSLLHKSDCHISKQNNEETSNNEVDSFNEFTDLQNNATPHKLKKNLYRSSKDAEKVKSAFLKDSSDDISKTPKKRRRYTRDSPPQSKRKHIMESMYAKKMLLTYSSSSDTEDEQLRNTLKEIKDYLLKGISSDEDGNKGDLKDLSDKECENIAESLSKDNSSESESEEMEVIKSKSIKSSQSDSDSKDTSKKLLSGSISDNSRKSKMGRSSATPDGICSQNSDIQDTHDKEIDGLTNLKSLKKTYRRRKPTGKDTSQSAKSRRRRNMAKASGLISNEGFLEAESSSDAASLSGSDHADNVELEDMPRVKLSDINGDGIGHLAKDDLLGESDTSVSHDEKKSYKKEEDTDDDNVKSKRRKTIAISSDSEAGSSRKKDNNFRLSDFEDSEEESSEPVKNKRKKKVVDSDASGGSSDDGTKKRRRIKTLDESDASGSDTENEGRNKHGRKNIRKVMSKNQLEEATKKAAREEKERIARIAERQKLYNNLEFDESGKPDEVVLEKVVLDFDPETKEPLIQVDRGLVKKLKPHQANGIKFMWDACFESVKRIKKDKGSGCILAHCMGLGKTLQVVSLTHTLLTHGTLTGVNRVLVVCPLSTVLNWVNEFRMWLKHAEADFEVDVYELSKFKQNSERAFQLSQWFEHGGVCVLGYEMFRNLSADKGKKFKKKILKNFQESLVDPGPDLVVCDEGHLLKNEKTSLSQSMNRVKTRRRIVLTGTPLQNNLKEYYCMVQFVKPNLLGKYNEYLNRFVNPITNGQYTDSTEHDIRVMKRRSHVLHKMLDGAVQRRDYGVLAPFLPPKHEYVLFITLTDVQIKLYHHYLDNYSRRPQPGKSSGFLFPDFQSLQRIWTHPLVLKYNSERYEIMQQKKREREEEDSEGSLADFIDDDSTPDESSTEESSEDLSDMSDDSRKKSKKKKSAKKGKGKDNKASSRRGTRANPIELDDDEPIESLEVKSENPTEWWMKLVSEEELEDMRNSHKLILLFDILRQCEAIGDKLLVFSQSLYSLDLIEHFLGKVDEATQAGRVDEKLGGHVGSWSPGVDYFRLDGSTSCENRSIWCKNFNRIDNQRARLFLISTRAGGLGINLVAANRVVIFDVSWNPSHDVQSIFRVYRFGQKKPCYVYRFLAMGTMEEKIYERQVTKQAISKRVIDEQQIDRHYAENDLAELYKFEPQPPVPRPLPPLPKDRLFAEMLKEHEAQIYKYHEHDSLLENKEEETLSEEERRAAWEDFENEKTRPPPQPFLSPYAMHNGMVQGLLAQQQQMAMATISAMLRKDMPNLTEQQMRESVSLILASNPGMFGGYDYGLMQKMSEIYKYAQPGMMNPGMMNPMNAGSGMSGASGMGASPLHYEPPWQRQQQQQQQLRLQQLMQHQNTLGAKYYAGGLGSRDPMAMALQQQRARELMHRPRARGRPPFASTAPRAPSAHAGPNNAGDVVNLDSD